MTDGALDGAPGQASSSEQLLYKKLSELYLDPSNPRLGLGSSPAVTQAELLEQIVESHGVDDILSSLAVNGYFPTEPMVVVARKGGGYSVAEGNRRLAACLILERDGRAATESRRTETGQALRQRSGGTAITKVPVIVRKDGPELLAYLGVRHITATKDWDSYAKAAWIAKAVDSGLDVDRIVDMIGDKHRTVVRILEGYRLVTQLERKGVFRAAQSYKRGRGSNAEYPFSWIYTALDYQSVRNWIGFREKRPDPVPDEKLKDASQLMTFLFGDRDRQTQPVLADSRDIGSLAKVVATEEGRSALEQCGNVTAATEMLREPSEKMQASLEGALGELKGAWSALADAQFRPGEFSRVITTSSAVVRLARQILSRLRDIESGEDGDLE